MEGLLQRTKITFIIVLALSIIITVFAIYKPLRNEIESNIVDNYELIALSKIEVLKQKIKTSVQGTKSISSRSAIRKKIVEYKEGNISLDELIEFSKSKYEDGVNVLDDIIFAKRIVDGETIIDISFDGFVLPESIGIRNELEVSYSIVKREDIFYLEVYSPIIENGALMGADILGFSLNNILEQLNNDSIGFKIIESEQNAFDEGITISAGIVYYIGKINSNIYASIFIDKQLLFKDVYRTVLRIGLITLLGYLLMMLFVNFYLLRYVKSTIKNISVDRDEYKDYAFYDILTGAYSRRYLEELVKKQSDGIYYLALIDLDRFKMINDEYGHLVGDKVLQIVVHETKNIIKDDDKIIRFGGDEFIILFKEINEEQCLKVIERIQSKLINNDLFDFDINFSYGLTRINNFSNLYDEIKVADIELYKYKSSNRK